MSTALLILALNVIIFGAAFVAGWGLAHQIAEHRKRRRERIARWVKG